VRVESRKRVGEKYIFILENGSIGKGMLLLAYGRIDTHSNPALQMRADMGAVSDLLRIFECSYSYKAYDTRYISDAVSL